jgi:sugar lactone lactonase YvrE
VYARGAVVQSGGGGFGKSPIRTIRGAITDLSVPQGLALDGEGLLYVANRLGSTVTVYDARANGNTAPIRKISGENTGLGNPRGLALDGAGSLYVANHSVNGTVTVYAAGANGNVAPIRTISGPSTGLGAGASTGLPGPGGLAVDGAGTLYVADLAANSVMVYAPGANGNVAPIRTIRGANTRLNRPVMLLLRP